MITSLPYDTILFSFEVELFSSGDMFRLASYRTMDVSLFHQTFSLVGEITDFHIMIETSYVGQTSSGCVFVWLMLPGLDL